MGNSAIICDEVIHADAEAKLNDVVKSNDEESKIVPTNFNEKEHKIVKRKISPFCLDFF